MRIAVLAPDYPTRAAPDRYAFVHERSRLYAAQGHEVQAFRPGEAARDRWDEVPVVTGDTDNLVKALGRFGPDVLAVHAPTFRTMPVARKIDAPQVTWIHGHEALFNLWGVDDAPHALAKAVKWAKVIPRNVVQLSMLSGHLEGQRRIVFVSEWLRRSVEAQFAHVFRQAEVIHNPVDVERFSYRYDPVNARRGVSVRSWKSRVYGLDTAIDAFARVRGASLTLVGRGPLEGRYRWQVARAQSATELVAKPVPHARMPELLGRYGFFVAPSRAESQGLAMCEAMACGLPVVASRVGGIPEIVTSGREGFLVPPDDPDALAEAVEGIVRDPERHAELSRAARARIEAVCAAPRIVERELAVLTAAAEG